MSKFLRFMKANKAKRENERYAPTKTLCDEKGSPLEWEFRHVTAEELEEIRESCTIDVPITGKPNAYRQKTKGGLLVQKMIARSVVYPDLFDKELQDSYGVATPEKLVLAMVDDPGEYDKLGLWVSKFLGIDTSIEDKVAEAKN